MLLQRVQQVYIDTHILTASSTCVKKKSCCGHLHCSCLCYLPIAAICMIMLHMGLQLQKLSFFHQLLFMKLEVGIYQLIVSTLP